MRLSVLIAWLTTVAAGVLALSGSTFAWDPFPNRSILGYTQWQNRQNQQAQQLRQLMRQREVQQLREDRMSRDIDRRLDSLKRRQADLDLLRSVRGTGTVDRVLMMPESLRSSVRKSDQPPKAAAAKDDRDGPIRDAKTDLPAKDTRSDVGSRASAADDPAAEP